MTKQEENRMEYRYALEQLNQAISELERLDYHKINCDWLSLAHQLGNATEAINTITFNNALQEEN